VKTVSFMMLVPFDWVGCGFGVSRTSQEVKSGAEPTPRPGGAGQGNAFWQTLYPGEAEEA